MPHLTIEGLVDVKASDARGGALEHGQLIHVAKNKILELRVGQVRIARQQLDHPAPLPFLEQMETVVTEKRTEVDVADEAGTATSA